MIDNFYLNIIWILLISLGLNYFFFIFAWIFKSDVFTDITYTMTFALISIIFFAWKQNFHLNQILIFIIVNIWAVALGYRLLNRIIKMKVDHRFDNMRNSFIKFGGFWTLQALTVWIIILPATMFLIVPERVLDTSQNTGFISILLLIAAGALWIEGLADTQKQIYYDKLKINPNPNSFLKTGLWKYSRHPNYFGEIVFWYVIAITTISSTLINKADVEYLPMIAFFISPIWINFLLIYVSGIRMLELRWFKEYAHIPEFHQYLKKTSMLIPFIGKKGILSISKKAYDKSLRKEI